MASAFQVMLLDVTADYVRIDKLVWTYNNNFSNRDSIVPASLVW